MKTRTAILITVLVLAVGAVSAALAFAGTSPDQSSDRQAQKPALQTTFVDPSPDAAIDDSRDDSNSDSYKDDSRDDSNSDSYTDDSRDDVKDDSPDAAASLILR